MRRPALPMSAPNPILLLVFLGSGLLFVGLSIPLMRGRVKPNPWYGFRTPRTLKHPGVWYPANAYSAKGLLWSGIATSLAAVIPYWVPGVETDTYAVVVIAVMSTTLLATVVASFAYLARLDDDGKLR